MTAVDVDALDAAVAQYEAGGWEAFEGLFTVMPALPELLAEVRRGRALREEYDELRHRLKALVDEWDAMARNLHHIPVAEAYADVVIGLRAVLAAVDPS